MTPEQTQSLRRLFDGQHISSLGTLHEGEPYVSMVPFAVLPDASALVIHVSQLSSHTADMVDSPRVSLLVVAPDTGGTPAQALARVTIQGRAEHDTSSTPGYASAREAYLSRFPQAVGTFALPDFLLFSIRPLSIRFIAGFAQALTLTPAAFATALSPVATLEEIPGMKNVDPFLLAAIEEAELGLFEGGIPIGSVLVHSGAIVGRGHNRRVQRDSTVLHGEMDALESAGRRPASFYRASTLYTTLSPCSMCSGAILLYGIPRVVIGENLSFMGEEQWLSGRGVVVQVVQDERCIRLMREFVRSHPSLWAEDIGE